MASAVNSGPVKRMVRVMCTPWLFYLSAAAAIWRSGVV
jgi:hypothetical protein